MNIRISTKLIAGFVAVALLNVLVGGAGLYFVDRINKTLNNITDVAAPIVENSDKLIANIREATKVSEEIIADEEMADVSMLVEEFNGLTAQFDQTYAYLRSMVTDRKLIAELIVARDEQKRFAKHTHEMVAAHSMELENEILANRLLKEFDAAGSVLTASLDEFARKNESEMAVAEEEGDRLEVTGATAAAINRILGALFDEDYPVVASALKLQRLVLEMQDTAGEYVAEETIGNLPSIRDEFIQLHEAALPHIAVLDRLAETKEDKEDAVALASMFKNWLLLASNSGQIFDVHRRMLNAEYRADALTEQLEVDADKVAEALNQVSSSALAISKGADELAAGAVGQATTAIVTLLSLALIISAGLIAVLINTIIRPVGRITEAMIKLGSSYDADKKPILDQISEIDRLRAAFDHMEERLSETTQGLESLVQQRTAELHTANENLEEELTVRQSLEQQLVRAQKLEGLGTLAGGIAHDFNNMLYVIIGCNQLALEQLPQSDPCRDLLLKVDQAAQRSKSIVSQILLFSRQRLPDRIPVEIKTVVEDAITLLRAALPSSLTLKVSIDHDCWTVMADQTQLHQVVVNLMTNASQAYPDRKGEIELKMANAIVDPSKATHHVGLETGPYIHMTISDKGSGISGEYLDKIFDPFFTTKPVGEGTGLGLAVVHGIVKSHEGVITISSAVGRGTTVEVYFPACVNAHDPVGPHRATEHSVLKGTEL
ncbi:ATP-binding protein [Hoeflea sp. TYP-13]|uniref:ATP-binding protein n=1 Tax=Hoeflea sp. TYP-13 TaxID=3230023 RepID=UPI0034C690AD